MKTPWVFVDCEARGTSPVHGVLTEFGAVHYDTRDTFYGRLFEATPDPENPAISIVGERLATDAEVAGSFAAWLPAAMMALANLTVFLPAAETISR